MSRGRNTQCRHFDVVQVTNEAPTNRRGGAATVVAALHAELLARDISTAMVVVDHVHSEPEIADTLAAYPNVIFSDPDALAAITGDVWHIHAYRYTADLLEHVSRVPVLATLHSLAAAETSGLPPSFGDDIAGQIQLMQCAASVALVSQHELARYRQLGYERKYQPAHVVYNGVQTPSWHAKNLGRERLGFCGRLVPRKHPEYLLRLLAEPAFADCRALVAGRPFTADIEHWVSQLGIDAHVDFLGWCGGPRLERFYASIDALVVPSSYEPSGLVAIEASLRGIPVICTPVDGLSETMAEHAFVAIDESYASVLAAAQAWQAATDRDIAELTQAARLRASTMFTASAMADRYLALYNDLRGAPARVRGTTAK
jgi:glycosyltransferase involved in cell wall biosynthesis